MSSNPGYPPNPLSIPLINSNLVPIRTFPRRPTTQDVKYRPGQFAILNNNPSTGSAGELWYLSYFSSGVPQWVQLAAGGVDLESFIPDSGTSPVVADASNQVTMAGGTNLNTVGGTNTLTFNLDDPFSVAAATITTLGSTTGNITTVNSTTVNATTFDTNVAAAAVTLAGTTLAADGTDTNINLTLTPKGTGFLTTTKAASGQWWQFIDGTDTFGYYNNAGTPEAAVTASIGSWCSDTTNGAIYVKNTGDATNTGWVELDSGTGDVVGPASATDNALARFDSTSGKLVQDSTVIVTDAGEMTNASQPAFSANLGTQADNVTGSGTAYTLGDTDVGVALTEIFDQNGDFAPGSAAGAIFTAPVTGKYNLYVYWIALGCTVATNFDTQIVTSNRGYPITFVKAAGSENESQALSVLADMDALDTSTSVLTVTGEAGDTVDIGNTSTVFMGNLAC
jgi:hypothetical protein